MSKATLLCLHGWGGSGESFTELREALKHDPVQILTPDLPGFGDEPEPRHPWTVDDYADWVENWLRRNEKWKIENGKLLLLAHSHGGRIAIKLVAGDRLSPAHLYLCAAAGIRHPRHIKRIVGLLLAKTGKIFLSVPGMKKLQPLGKKFLYKLVRVHDYEKASPVMRDTLINVTRENLTPLLSCITCPADIFWGKDDRMTPVSDAYVMHKKIKDSRLHVYAGIRHGVHKQKAAEIAAVIRTNLASL
ncbi:MAG TPA: alpha/beta fold hydrolase [Candidatus Peribacteraceae bacterium]|nr:alpha/beta fold hydrolase [Candidatus Peribacteraceae bacterium]